MEMASQAKKLLRALTTPEQIHIQHGINMVEIIAAHTLMKLKVLEAIPETGSISLEDLAKVTGVQDSLLERMARPLVVTGFLDQVQPSHPSNDTAIVYKHTKFSLAYTIFPHKQQETKPAYYFFRTLYDQYLKLMLNFADDYLPFVAALERDEDQVQNAPTSSQAPSSSSAPTSRVLEPQDPRHNPYTFAIGQYGKATPWEIMGRDPERLQIFQRAMKGLDVMIPPVGHFDFGLLASTSDDAEGKEEVEEEKEVVELVDIGGGHGVVLKQILDAYPQLNPEKVVLQNIEHVVELARQRQESGVGLPKGVKMMVHDFMGVQPIRGAKAYFMRMILHDYSDAVATQILARLAEAMSPESRALICELVLPQRVGEAELGTIMLDHCVMSIAGKERTEEGLRKIFDAAGLDLVKVWRAPGVTGAVAEGRLKSCSAGRQHLDG
ncbi:S-adenosyl-L-methionine-dependent methyltransferase [Sordaria brevicollis]|uniref:S-adenosyl-L-methionine-dependent methyltransferase n=1 Tax=Sordaria brevicollis TaxID=83679 RepID=A0AAE0U649_SORBR|nr:S-adenosyl-L-methionine-dependent methyltransferase [Sordaria brevicollis]